MTTTISTPHPFATDFLRGFSSLVRQLFLIMLPKKKNVVQYNSKRTNRDNNIVQTREPGKVVARAFV